MIGYLLDDSRNALLEGRRPGGIRDEKGSRTRTGVGIYRGVIQDQDWGDLGLTRIGGMEARRVSGQGLI